MLFPARPCHVSKNCICLWSLLHAQSLAKCLAGVRQVLDDCLMNEDDNCVGRTEPEY